MSTHHLKFQPPALYSYSPANVLENETLDEHQIIAKYLHHRLAKEIDPVLKALDIVIQRADTSVQAHDPSSGSSTVESNKIAATCASIAESLSKIGQRISNVESNYSPFISYFGHPITSNGEISNKVNQGNQISLSLAPSQSQYYCSKARVHDHDQYSHLLDELLLSSTKLSNENAVSPATQSMDVNSAVFVKSVLDIFGNKEDSQFLTPSVTMQQDFAEGFINRAGRHKPFSHSTGYSHEDQRRAINPNSHSSGVLDDHLRKSFVRDRLIQRDIIEYLVATGRLVSAQQCALQYNFISQVKSNKTASGTPTEDCGCPISDFSPAARKALMPFHGIRLPSQVVNPNKCTLNASMGSMTETPRGHATSISQRSGNDGSTSGLRCRNTPLQKSPSLRGQPMGHSGSKQVTPVLRPQSQVSVSSNSSSRMKGTATGSVSDINGLKHTLLPLTPPSLGRTSSYPHAADSLHPNGFRLTPIHDDGLNGNLIIDEEQRFNFLSILCHGLISALGDLESRSKKLFKLLRFYPGTNTSVCNDNGGICAETRLFIDSLHDATILAFNTRQEAAYIYHSHSTSNEILSESNPASGNVDDTLDEGTGRKEKRRVYIAARNTEFIKRANFLLDEKNVLYSTRGRADNVHSDSVTSGIGANKSNTPKKRTRSALKSCNNKSLNNTTPEYRSKKLESESEAQSFPNSAKFNELRRHSTGTLLNDPSKGSNEGNVRSVNANSCGSFSDLQSGSTHQPIKWTNGDSNNDIVFHEPLQIFPSAARKRSGNNAVVKNKIPRRIPATTVCDAIKDLYQHIVSVLLPSAEEQTGGDQYTKGICNSPIISEIGDDTQKERINKYNVMLRHIKNDVLGGPEVELLQSLLQECIFDVSTSSVDSHGICKVGDDGTSVCDRPRILTRCALSCLYFMDHLAPYLTAPASHEGMITPYSEPSFERDRRDSSRAVCAPKCRRIALLMEKPLSSLREQYGVMLSCLLNDAVNCVGEDEGPSFGNDTNDDNDFGRNGSSQRKRPLHLLLTKKLAQFERDSLLLKRRSHIFCKYTGNCIMGGDSEVKKDDMIDNCIHKPNRHSLTEIYPLSSNTKGTESIKLYGPLAYFSDTDLSSQWSLPTQDATNLPNTSSIDDVIALAKLDGLTLEIDGNVIISPDAKSTDDKKSDHHCTDACPSSGNTHHTPSDLAAPYSINNVSFTSNNYSSLNSQDRGEALALPNGTVFSKALLPHLLCRYSTSGSDPSEGRPKRSSDTELADRRNTRDRSHITRFLESQRTVISTSQDDGSTRSPPSVSGRDYSIYRLSEALDHRLRAVRRDMSLPEDYSRHGLSIGTQEGSDNTSSAAAAVRSSRFGSSDNEMHNELPVSVAEEEVISERHYVDDEASVQQRPDNQQNHSPTTWSNDSGNHCDDEDNTSNAGEDRRQPVSVSTDEDLIGTRESHTSTMESQSEERLSPQHVASGITPPVLMTVPSGDADEDVEEDQEAEVTVYEDFDYSRDDDGGDEFETTMQSSEHEGALSYSVLSLTALDNLEGRSGTTNTANTTTNAQRSSVYGVQSTRRYRGTGSTSAISSILLDILTSNRSTSNSRDIYHGVGRRLPSSAQPEVGSSDENPRSPEYQSIDVEPLMNAVRCPRTGNVFRLSTIKKVYFL